MKRGNWGMVREREESSGENVCMLSVSKYELALSTW